MSDPEKTFVAWDEGEQGISDAMFINILQKVDLKMWDVVLHLGDME